MQWASLGEGNLTPMHLAADEGRCDAIRTLQSLNTDPCCKNETGDTPMHLAAAYGGIAAVEVLLEIRADINEGNFKNWTPLMMVTD